MRKYLLAKEKTITEELDYYCHFTVATCALKLVDLITMRIYMIAKYQLQECYIIIANCKLN